MIQNPKVKGQVKSKGIKKEEAKHLKKSNGVKYYAHLIFQKQKKEHVII